MKRLPPNFQRSVRMLSAGFLAAFAGLFLSTPAAPAMGFLDTPQWFPSEIQAISLYCAGINQVSSNPRAALPILQQARHDSTAAMAHGGATVPLVVHNDQVIARAIMTAQADASATSANTAPVQTTPPSENTVPVTGQAVVKQNSGNNQVKLGNHLIAATFRVH